VNIRPTAGDLAPMQVGGSSGSAASAVELAAAAVDPATVGQAILKPAGVVPLFVPGGDALGDEGVQVGAVVKTRPRPALPTPDEVTAHEATHHPYRSWCRHCVAGAGRRDGHAAVSVASRDEGIVTISSDYC
jgi:hypothetical protein